MNLANLDYFYEYDETINYCHGDLDITKSVEFNFGFMNNFRIRSNLENFLDHYNLQNNLVMLSNLVNYIKNG